MQELDVTLKGKRLAALDYGDARIGLAVCDELHIAVSTRPVIVNDSKVMSTLVQALLDSRVDVVFVGVPRLLHGETSATIEKIEKFILLLREHISQPVFETDEAFTTKRAKELMVASGKRKKQRQAKGAKDAVAAAIMLRDILDELL
ncbi:MAG: Holliday junction resolvase RuvX [Ignavibacteria bacterium]|nr:Holliday junction resolvase RuvX [Ignavibacteria bacterium]